MEQQTVISLNGNWNLTFTLPDTEETVRTTAPVPGNVERVLQKLGLIEEIMPADQENATAKFNGVDDWTYTTVFDAPACPEGWTRQLVFEGIDTIAEVYLNGQQLLLCRDMHMTYRVAVPDLRAAGNELQVVIRSAELWSRQQGFDMYSLATDGSNLAVYLRKARHHWGWDNAPRLVTSGIFRPVYLELLPPKRFEEVYLYTKSIDDTTAAIGASWIYATDRRYIDDHAVRLTLLDGDRVIFEQTNRAESVRGDVTCNLHRSDIELWWPSGFGEPKLYTVKLEMLDHGEVAAVYTAPFGIRTLYLEHTDDRAADGSGAFQFYVNGEKLFVRGTNWKPLRALSSEADAETKKGRALQELCELHCNMVRMWGGGFYESDPFFDFCDRNGILVWQDFMFGCEVPAVSSDYCALVEEEAAQVVRRLRNHPSMAVWCGDNEVDQVISDWHKMNDVRTSDNRISREVLRLAVVHHDPYRCYVESSPVISDALKRQMLTAQQGRTDPRSQPGIVPTEIHLYPDVLREPELLRGCRSFFLGETGPWGMNAISTAPEILEREAARAKRLWDSYNDAYIGLHQHDNYFRYWRTVGRNACLTRYGRDFSFEEFPDYSVAVNLLCAELFKDIIEYCRVQRWEKTGVLWWSLMDMWPMLFNYSVMDWKYRRKLPWYWIRQSQQAFALVGVRVEVGGELSVYAVNDTLDVHTARYTITAYDANGQGEVLASGICRQAPNSAGLIQRIAESSEPQLWILRWEEDGAVGVNHVMTGPTSFETTKLWVARIAEAYGCRDDLQEQL